MADSTMTDISKMKVVDLRKELKSRGLSYAGDKSDLVARLQSAMAQDDHGDINLDSDEIDSDGVLDDEDDKSQNDILDDATVDTLNEELALEEKSPIKETIEVKPPRTLKRRITSDTTKTVENKDAGAKKIVLNRNVSIINTSKSVEEENKETEKHDEHVTDTPSKTETNKIKITADIDLKTRMEMRAKRFGLPVKMTDEQRKEARKQRFNQNTNSVNSEGKVITTVNNPSLSDNLDKLKQRAQRFGQSVSAIMTDIEKKEKLEKRKAKFGTVA